MYLPILYSASYSSVVARLKSLEELAISYITPILSRRSCDPVMRPDEVSANTPTRTPRRRTTNVATPGSTRRSARIAARGTGRFAADRDAAPETYSRTRHVTTTTTSSYSAYDSRVVHADDSPRSSMSNGTTSWKSRNQSDSMSNQRTFFDRLHATKSDKYISHLYGECVFSSFWCSIDRQKT